MVFQAYGSPLPVVSGGGADPAPVLAVYRRGGNILCLQRLLKEKQRVSAALHKKALGCLGVVHKTVRQAKGVTFLLVTPFALRG